MKDYKVNIQQLLYGYYIKYDILNELNTRAFTNTVYSSSNDLDVYIDLYDMLYQLYNTNVYADKKFTIVSSVVNLAAHIRSYYKNIGVRTRIYLVYADCSTISHKQYYYDFGNVSVINMLNYDSIHQLITSQLKMVQIIVAYIYNVYYVERTCDFATFCYNNISNSNNTPSIMITKSSYAYQVPALLDNAFIFRPKKSKGVDISFMVNKQNALYIFCNKLNEKNMAKLRYINSSMLSLIMALTKLPDKNVISLINSTTVINKIFDAVMNNTILNNYNSDIEYVCKHIDIDDKFINNVRNRFYAIDIIYQNRVYEQTAESKDITYLVDLQNKKDLWIINNKYFYNNPLDLLGLGG